MSEETRRLLDLQVGPDTVRLVLDGGEELELARESVPPQIPLDGSGIGGSISSPLLAEIRLAAQRKLVARRVFTLLDRRLLPVARLRRKLQDEGFAAAAVEAVLAQMQERGLYSDRKFAAAYCRDRLLSRPVGSRYLQQKLREKQVAASVAAEVVAEVLDPDTEAELAREAARRKWRSLGNRVDVRSEQKVVRHLQSRGFPAALVWKAVRVERPAEDASPEGDSS